MLTPEAKRAKKTHVSKHERRQNAMADGDQVTLNTTRQHTTKTFFLLVFDHFLSLSFEAFIIFKFMINIFVTERLH